MQQNISNVLLAHEVGDCLRDAVIRPQQAKQDMASTMFDQLLKDPKYADVYFIQTNACEKDSHEYSVDGVHPDDHGYYLWSKSIEKPILTILAKYGIK